MNWREKDWLPMGLAVVLLVCGTVLAYVGNPRGDGLLGIGIGIVTGTVLRKRQGSPSIPPGAGAVLALATFAWALVGCGGSTPPPSVCAVARAARVPCAVVEAYAARCELDAGPRE